LNNLQPSTINWKNTNVNEVSKERIAYLKLQSDFEELKNQLDKQSQKSVSNSNDKENLSKNSSVVEAEIVSATNECKV
jgi:hypothetical protein